MTHLRLRILLLLALVITAGYTLAAQQVEPTPGAISVPTETATLTPTPRPSLTPNTASTQPPVTPTRGAITAATPTPTATSPADDPRLAVCRAPLLPGFVPHTIRPGDRLDVLLAGSTALTVTQIAALNCLDDPAALPNGATIWLPDLRSEPFIPVDPDPAADVAQIRSLSALPETPDNSNGVAFAWEADATAAYFYACPLEGDACPRPVGQPPLPPTALHQINGFLTAGSYRYRLEVVDGAERDTADITIAVTCTYEALSANPRCPVSAPAAVFAVYQPFERGGLLWFSDTGLIYVLREDGGVQVAADTYEEGQLETALTAPDGLYAPIRGFRLVWDALGGAEGVLGWGTAAEGGFDALRQPAGRQSYTTYVRITPQLTIALTVLPGSAAGYWTQVNR